jgi:endonuclease/exonuclease/phosphatase family metal-dependent hydrolase
MAAAAGAQTLTLAESNATTLRAGSYAGRNYSNEKVIETRASADADYVRRGLLKFDTHTTIAAGAAIASARLTVTVAPGSNGESRTLSAYGVTTSYDEAAATWKSRNSSARWAKAGGDLANRYDTATITGTSGSKVTFDVTELVQDAVRGDFGMRYTRIALIDQGSSSRGSYKAIHSDDATSAGNRPVLTVTLGTTQTATPPSATPPTSTTSSTQLRVLQYNTHHGGYGTDGRYDTNRLANWIVKMNPDVVMLNEIEKYTGWGNQNQPEVYKNLLQSKTGKTWYYIFAQEFGDWSSNGKGNLILSRKAFTSTDRYALVHNGDRSAAEAILTWNGHPITFILTHLDPDSHSLRLTQAKEMTTWAGSEPETKILTGDMNAWPDQTSIAQLNKYFNDSWAVAASKGTAKAFSGNSGETKNGRIDYIFYSKGSTHLSVRSSQVYDTRDSNGVMPSDHRPVLTVFDVR